MHGVVPNPPVGDLTPVERTRSGDVASMLRRRIQWGMHLGIVKSGDRLPSLRAAAAEFGVDQRSILSAYRALASEGLVDMRPRSGIYVATPPRQGFDRPPAVQWMLDMFIEGFNRGVAPVNLGARLSESLNAGCRSAVCVECNSDGALAITLQIQDDFGVPSTWVDVATLGDAETRRKIGDADLVLTTHFHATQVRPLTEEMRRPLVIVTSDRDYSSQIRSSLGRGPVYIIGADVRLADKLCAAWAGARWLANFRPIVIGRDDLASIPTGSPVFVTRAAVEAIAPESLPQGAVLMHHTFSAETRATILDVLLSASQASANEQPQRSRAAAG